VPGIVQGQGWSQVFVAGTKVREHLSSRPPSMDCGNQLPARTAVGAEAERNRGCTGCHAQWIEPTG